jgi:hypothetical protein
VISFVTFKWTKPGYRSTFTAAHVNVSRHMIERHYPHPHRFICVTDDPKGIDAGIEVIPIWTDHADIPNPSWPSGPSCYRRLKVFSKEFGQIAGERFVCFDLDMVFTGDLTRLFSRTEDFLIWHTGNPRIPFCASMFMMTAGKFSHVWDDFDPESSPKKALESQMKGSDQAWIAHKLGMKLAGWGTNDGVYSYRDHIIRNFAGKLPKNASAVVFHGKPDPWDMTALQASPWIFDHYY